ncbi:hypothetical protein H310_11654 [Aphanomyces invadans]|uniref:Uncharacterized protein n=1 Tax=Aphanomyces invadans TaxID=157072 RepID=A0A024TKU7_9STRA|nr:hypothetical protein H310_11654 [Aphanomyces invadans]ETV94668.1 hypothetical protein H310_11654 [Aphanomyces invadans]|eukprot:XP_008876613.1 hypothetical protein H310_11654 [Aphanomyces invadans]
MGRPALNKTKLTKSSRKHSILMYSLGFCIPVLVVLAALMSNDDSNQLVVGAKVDATTATVRSADEPSRLSEATKPKYSEVQRRAVQHLQKALGHFEAQKWPLVLEECEKAIQIDPDMVFAHALMGNALNVMMQWQQAVNSWRKATELNPTSSEFYYHLGFALSQHAQDQVTNQRKFALSNDAISSFERYLVLVENDPEATQAQMSLAHANLGTMYKVNKLREKQALALEHFEAAATLDPTNELAYFNIGLMYAEKYEKTPDEAFLERAIQSLERAVELNPKNKQYRAIRDALIGNASPAELMAVMQQV